MFVFKHPKYYEELRKELKKLGEKAMKDEATSDKQQVTSDKRQAQATSDKRLSKTAIKIHDAWCVANGYKRQATSCDILTQDNLPVYKSSDYKASSIKRQAA